MRPTGNCGHSQGSNCTYFLRGLHIVIKLLKISSKTGPQLFISCSTEVQNHKRKDTPYYVLPATPASAYLFYNSNVYS